MSGVHFRDYHLLLDEHAEQIFAMSDDIAERARKIGAPVQKLGVGHIRQVEERNECFRTLLSAGGVAAGWWPCWSGPPGDATNSAGNAQMPFNFKERIFFYSALHGGGE